MRLLLLYLNVFRAVSRIHENGRLEAQPQPSIFCTAMLSRAKAPNTSLNVQFCWDVLLIETIVIRQAHASHIVSTVKWWSMTYAISTLSNKLTLDKLLSTAIRPIYTIKQSTRQSINNLSIIYHLVSMNINVISQRSHWSTHIYAVRQRTATYDVWTHA